MNIFNPDLFRIFFNNKWDTDLHIYAVERPEFPILKKTYKEYKIKGIIGTQYEFEAYENRTLVISYNFVDTANINDKVREIERWLSDIKDNRLYFSDDPDYFFIVNKVEYSDIKRVYKIGGTFEVTFILEPFRKNIRSQEEMDFYLTDSKKEIFNDGDEESSPIIRLKKVSSYTTQLIINDNVIEIDIPEGEEIFINSELQLAFRGDTIANNSIKGKYPKLKKGINTIRVVGAAYVYITPNYVYI